jgi:glycosyltransferase involved in cell wall biosynthesis
MCCSTQWRSCPPGMTCGSSWLPGQPRLSRRRSRSGALRLGDAVQFASCFHHAEVAALLASAEVAVVPSLYEGFSLPAVEAMACGTPLIATRTEALPEVVGNDGAAGLLVAPGDAGALAAAIARLLDDPSRRARMGKAGR